MRRLSSSSSISAPVRPTCASARDEVLAPRTYPLANASGRDEVLMPRAYRLAKAGSRPTEYEDAIAWSGRRQRFAVADGASASAFARLWAYLLVHAYTAGWLEPDTLETDLTGIQDRWGSLVGRKTLPWYAVEQARRGAFAALVGLWLEPGHRWSALAVGDSCLFQVHDDKLVEAFPLADPDAFGNRPQLLCSRPAGNVNLRQCGAIQTIRGTWQPGDTFLLMSDALAAAFLTLSQTSPGQAHQFELTQAGFRRWVRTLRADRTLRNDDVSLLVLELNADAAA